ncbi:hypothetical protein HDU79_001049 [Rhizoclosmatium sp. JEL0117]|nr:hypothetical protein HDU79_001049 [Rhizoclosmatium sp. JEL0117]
MFLRTGDLDPNVPWFAPKDPSDSCLSPPHALTALSGFNSTVCVRGLEPNTQYEVRVCWPATTPGDYTFETNAEGGWIRVLVKSAGVLKPGLDPLVYYQHRYDLILESTYFGVIPQSAVPVIGACLIYLWIALQFGVPYFLKIFIELRPKPDAEGDKTATGTHNYNLRSKTPKSKKIN